jgi:hypothetical protein
MRSRERDPATTAYRFAVDPWEMNFCDVRILSELGEVLDYTVLYLTLIRRVVEKHWLPLESLDVAVNKAILDVKTQWPRYLDAFLERRPRP